jgi:hypothetical protein
MLALFGAPVAWAVHIGARYPLVLLACHDGVWWPMHAVSVACVLASLGALALSIVVWRRARAEMESVQGESAADPALRRRLARLGFLGRAGVVTSLVFLFTIFTEIIPVLFYEPCAGYGT